MHISVDDKRFDRVEHKRLINLPNSLSIRLKLDVYFDKIAL
jgi:hypothetical protein